MVEMRIEMKGKKKNEITDNSKVFAECYIKLYDIEKPERIITLSEAEYKKIEGEIERNKTEEFKNAHHHRAW